MTKFSEIKNIVKKFFKEQDALYSEYKAKEARARKRYSEETYKDEIRQKIWPTSAGTALANANIAISEVNAVLDQVEAEFKKWITKPLKPEVLQTLNLINDFDLPLNLNELRVIEQSVSDSFFGTKVFAGLARRAGYSIKTVDADTCIKALESAKANAEVAIKSYAGKAPDFPGRDLIDEWISRDGINYGERPIWQLIYATNFLKEGGEIDRLESLWNSINAPMQYHLTPEENEKLQDKIDGIFEKGYGDIDSQKADELLKEIPDIASRLKSSDDFPNKQIALDYFTLSGAKSEQKEIKKDESKIDPASGYAKTHVSSNGLVDEKILAQYK